MPKKGRRANVRQQVRSAGQRSVEFEQGQRRVSTPRGRNTTLTLAQRPQQSPTDRLSIYAQQTAQQVARSQQRERMTAFYQANMDRQEAEDTARRQEAERQQALTLQRQESARARRDRARAEVRDIRGRQARQQAEERRVMGERLGRAQARVDRATQRRQQRQLAQAQQDLMRQQSTQQLQQQQAISQQQLQQQQSIAQEERQQQQSIAQAQRQQQEVIARQKIESKERIAGEQLALQERGMARQDRLIQEHFTEMRGMFLNAQAGQERRIGELENTMRAGIRAIQDRTGQDKVDITYLNDATGRQLDHAGVKPPPQRLTLQRADTTDSEASELARQITGVDTGRHRPSQFSRSPTAPLPTTSAEFREARAGLKKVLTGADIEELARAYNRELELEAGSTRRARALAIDRRLQFLQEDPTPSPEQLARRRAFLQPEPEQEAGELVRTDTAKTTPFIDSDEEQITFIPPMPMGDRPDGSYSNKQGEKMMKWKRMYEDDDGNLKEGFVIRREPEPEPSFALTPASPQGRAVSPPRGARSTTPPNPRRTPPQSTLGGMAVEGLSSGLRTGAGVIGGLATGLGEAVYESLPSARDIGRATGEAIITGGATALQTARGLVEDVVSSTDEEEQGAGTGLLENVNPLEELGAGKYATGSDKRGWESKLGFTITDITGSINKNKKGAEYFLMKKDPSTKPNANYQIVDKTKPKLTGWRNVRIPKLNDLIREGKVSVS